MARTLTQLDEWPRHQTIDTFDTVATASAQWSDGYWFCFGDPEGTVAMITALRVYPNTNVMDGYAIVSLADGRQHNLRVSRRLRPRIDDLDCGPLSMEIFEGLRRMRLLCDDNPHGISFDVLWDGFAPPLDETAGARRVVDGRIVSERSNFTQVGNLTGVIRVGGTEFPLDTAWVGARDHSWGIGDTGVGERPNAFAAPAAGTEGGAAALRAFGHRQWALFRLPGRALYWWFHRSAEGRVAPFASQVDYPYGAAQAPSSYQSLALLEPEFDSGRRRLKSARLEFERSGGGRERFAVSTVSQPVYMQGGGYWGGYADGLGRGAFRGELLVEGDVWDVSHPTLVRDLRGNPLPQRMGAWAETYALIENLDDPSERGLGLLEAVTAGPYPGITEDG